MCKIFSCFTCCFKKKSDIKDPLITESKIPPAIAESKIPFSKAEDNVDWRMYGDEEVNPWDKAFSNIEYLKTLSQAKSLEQKLQGTYGSPGRPLP